MTSDPPPKRQLLILLLVALLSSTGSGCDEDCGSAGRFTERNGLNVIVVCGDFPTRTPTPTPTPQS